MAQTHRRPRHLAHSRHRRRHPQGKQQDPYWKPFFDGFPPISHWLGAGEARHRGGVLQRPRAELLPRQDAHLCIVGAAPEYRNADEGWGIPTTAPLPGNLDLSWHLINHLIEREFDIVTCQEMLIDHACTLPFKLFWPGHEVAPVKIVPININTVQFPLPTARRVYKLGQAVGEAIRAWDSSERVVVLGTGGLSHQLEGERAGFINKRFDLQFLDSMESNPEWATQFSDLELVEKAGTQGVELLNWLAMRGAVSAGGASVKKVHGNYHIPISNTATGLLALEVA
jgi:protocatechuate 4,5-dioxygenase beta chain